MSVLRDVNGAQLLPHVRDERAVTTRWQAQQVVSADLLSRGGTHDVHNLIALCGGSGGMAGGNHSGCHGIAHSDGEPSGLSIGRGYRSELMPVLYRGTWVLPGDDGSLRRLTEATADLLMGGDSGG